MYIAIVDDDEQDNEKITALLHHHLSNRLPQEAAICQIDSFSNAEDFLQAFTPNHYAIVIMDIYMSELNGMDAAQRIAALDSSCHIIFLTSSTDYVLEGYSVHAAGYILKPPEEHLNQFHQAIDYCLELLHLDQETLSVTIDNMDVTVPFVDIYYLDCQNSRTVVLHTADKTLKTSNMYDECLNQLCHHKAFLECYHRLTVNMDKIDIMQEDTFLLKNGDTIPISRRKKNEVKHAYLTYLTEY